MDRLLNLEDLKETNGASKLLKNQNDMLNKADSSFYSSVPPQLRQLKCPLKYR